MFSSEFSFDYKIKKGVELLNLPKVKEAEQLLDEVVKYIFNINNQNTSKEKIFDLEEDFKYYYVDFLKLGIDLNKDKITWWEFDTILEGIFLQESSVIGKVIGYRTYEKPPKSLKGSEEKEHRFYMEKKKHYSLKSDKKIEESFEKLYTYLEHKAGGTQ